MPLYEFNQNNSGGKFTVDDQLCHRLFIEADDDMEADFIAQSKGVYFNGVDNGSDCPCCGDRWHSAEGHDAITLNYGAFPKDEADEIAQEYGCEVKPTTSKFWKGRYDVVFPSLEKYAQYLADKFGWTTPDCRIFYKDGRVVVIGGSRKRLRKGGV